MTAFTRGKSGSDSLVLHFPHRKPLGEGPSQDMRHRWEWPAAEAEQKFQPFYGPAGVEVGEVEGLRVEKYWVRAEKSTLVKAP